MTVTIETRAIWTFAAGVAMAVIGIVAFQAMRADAAPGDADATFVPITACRLVDTRPPDFRVGPLGTFAAETTETVQAHGEQGQCSIPTDAVGLTLNVTAVDATAPTFLTIWGDGERPLASSLNPAPGQPPTPNAVTVDLAADGSFRIYNLAGQVDVIVDVTGYYTDASLRDLHERLDDALARLAAVEAQAAESAAKLEPVSVGDVAGLPTFTMSGVNVRVVNGSGSTECSVPSRDDCDGLGNLIIGYADNPAGVPLTRMGSHNLVLGVSNSWTSHSGIVAGATNFIDDEFAVAFGSGNTASGRFAAVTGGSGNVASGGGASVSGGSGNTSSGNSTSVSGGFDNTAGPKPGDGDCSAQARGASVAGGRNNHSCDDYAAILGGVDNLNEGSYDSIIGGDGIVCAVAAQGACGEFSNQTAEWDTAD